MAGSGIEPGSSSRTGKWQGLAYVWGEGASEGLPDVFVGWVLFVFLDTDMQQVLWRPVVHHCLAYLPACIHSAISTRCCCW
jgi:hypothetical protein